MPSRPVTTIALAATLWAGTAVLPFVAEDASGSVLALLVIPPAVVAAGLGIRGGLLAGLFSTGMLSLWVAFDGAGVEWMEVACSAAAILSAGTIVGALSDRLADRERSILRLREGIEDLKASGTQLVAQLLEAEDRERERLAQGLHDGPLQTLLVANQDLMDVSPENPDVAGVQRGVGTAIGEMRSAVSDLHPATASHGDLEASLRATAQRAAELGRFDVVVDVAPDAIELRDSLVVSIARELLTNAAKHAQATRVTVRVRATDSALELSVGDDGVGMRGDVGVAAIYGHVGLRSIWERLRAVGGTLEFSTPPGGGTIAKATVPIEGGRDPSSGVVSEG